MKVKYDVQVNVYYSGGRELFVAVAPGRYAYLTATQTRRLIAKLQKELAKFPEPKRRSKK